MKNLDLKPFFQGLKKTVTDNSSQILLWVGVTCSISAIVTAVPATIKAVKLVEKEKKRVNKDKLTFWETIKTTWHCYIPPVVLGTISVVCVAESASIATKKTAAVAAAYQLTASAFEEYREQVVSKIGEKKEDEIRDNTSKKKMNETPLTENNLFFTGMGDTLCFDTVSGRYFKSDIDKINRIINDLNRQMLSSGSITLNEFYDEIGLDHIAIGDGIGWNTEKGFIDVKYGSHLASNGVPCLVLDYRIYPSHI